MQAIMSILMGAMGLGQALTDMADVKEGREATERVLDLVYSQDLQIDSLASTGARLSDVKGEIEVRLDERGLCVIYVFSRPSSLDVSAVEEAHTSLPSLSLQRARRYSSRTSPSATPPAPTNTSSAARTSPKASLSASPPAKLSPSSGSLAQGRARRLR